MYQLEDIFCPQLYPRACICLMMYFKNNWNAGPFFYFMDFLEEKKTIWQRGLKMAIIGSDAPEFYKLV
jgi:hypothetical protein